MENIKKMIYPTSGLVIIGAIIACLVYCCRKNKRNINNTPDHNLSQNGPSPNSENVMSTAKRIKEISMKAFESVYSKLQREQISVPEANKLDQGKRLLQADNGENFEDPSDVTNGSSTQKFIKTNKSSRKFIRICFSCLEEEEEIDNVNNPDELLEEPFFTTDQENDVKTSIKSVIVNIDETTSNPGAEKIETREDFTKIERGRKCNMDRNALVNINEDRSIYAELYKQLCCYNTHSQSLSNSRESVNEICKVHLRNQLGQKIDDTFRRCINDFGFQLGRSVVIPIQTSASSNS